MPEFIEEKLQKILVALPKNKSCVAIEDIAYRTSSEFNTIDELKEYLKELKARRLVSFKMGGGYHITDTALDSVAEDISPEHYVIRKLRENDGTLNLFLLPTSKFKSEIEKIATIKKLETEGLIEKVVGAVGQTYTLTEDFNRKASTSIFGPESTIFRPPKYKGLNDKVAVPVVPKMITPNYEEIIRPLLKPDNAKVDLVETTSKPPTIFSKIWKLANTNPIWTTVIGGIITAVILKILHLL